MIYVDSREQRKMSESFPNGTPVHVMELESADFMFYGNGPKGPSSWLVGIERKTTTDYIDSMRSGRLGDQLRRMSESYDVYYVLIEGITRITDADNVEQYVQVKDALGRKRWIWQDIIPGRQSIALNEWQGYINNNEMVVGARVLRSNNMVETAKMVKSIWLYLTLKEFEEHQAHLKPYHPVSPWKKPKLVDKWLHDLYGLGPKVIPQAKGLAGSAAGIVRLDEEAWMSLEGIGKKKAQSFVKQIMEEV